MRRVIWILGMTCVLAAALYLSRVWVFELWDRAGLFGWRELRPQGGLLGRWLRGTPAAPFELLLWVIGVFVLLTGLQKLFDRTGPKDD